MIVFSGATSASSGTRTSTSRTGAAPAPDRGQDMLRDVDEEDGGTNSCVIDCEDWASSPGADPAPASVGASVNAPREPEGPAPLPPAPAREPSLASPASNAEGICATLREMRLTTGSRSDRADRAKCTGSPPGCAPVANRGLFRRALGGLIRSFSEDEPPGCAR
jgi:hypothetical protein